MQITSNFKVKVTFSCLTKIKICGDKKVKENVFGRNFHTINHMRICAKNIFEIKQNLAIIRWQSVS